MYSTKQLHVYLIHWGIALIVILLFLSACQENREKRPPQDLLSEETYIDLIIEFQLIDAYYKRFRSEKDTLPDFVTMRNKVLQKYDTNWMQFKRSHDYYKNQPEKQLDRIDKAIEKLRKRNRRPGGESQDRN